MLWQCVDQLALTERADRPGRADDRRDVSVVKTPRRVWNSGEFPGVALVTAATVIAEIGDFRRFTHSRRSAVRRTHPRGLRLGRKQRIGHIAKTGRPICVGSCNRRLGPPSHDDMCEKSIFLRIAKRSGRKAAAVAVARKLLTWMHSAVTKGEPTEHASPRDN